MKKKMMVVFGIFAMFITLHLVPAAAQQSTQSAEQAREWVCPRTGETVRAGQGSCCGQQVRHRGGRQGKMGNPGWGRAQMGGFPASEKPAGAVQ